MLISLVHATWFRAGGVKEHHRLWLARAVDPDNVEIVVGVDSHDHVAIADCEGMRVAVGEPSENLSTAVRNWNSAALMARGRLLFVISDDLEPGEGWDESLRSVARRLPARVPWVLNIGDTGSKPSLLLRHPVVNRHFYSQLGLWNSSFSGMYCDHDLTYRAFFNSVIFSAENLRYEHKSPTTSPGLVASLSQEKANRKSEYERGLWALQSLWGPNILSVVPRNVSISRFRAVNFARFWIRRYLSLLVRVPQRIRFPKMAAGNSDTP